MIRLGRRFGEMRTIGTSGVVFVLLLTSCGGRDLRGKWSKSNDGGTYLVVDRLKDFGGCEKIWVDAKAWSHREDEVGRIDPGNHTIACDEKSVAISFSVARGTTYHFNYWGP